MTSKAVLLILPDHLSESILEKYGKDRKIIVVESYPELSYYKNHKKKLVFFISAMRHFFEDNKGKYDMDYLATENDLKKLLSDLKGDIECCEPGDYRTLEILKSMKVKILRDFRFICDIQEFKKWTGGKKTLLMEYFYRQMRQKTGILMDKGGPIGGKWNFDSENRSSVDPKVSPRKISEYKIDSITKETIKIVESKFGHHFGDINPFWFAVDKAGAEAHFEDFLKHHLDNFGIYQDAMQDGATFMFHSAIAQYLNLGLLDPLEVCNKAANCVKSGARLESVEGFIRQILGWREFVRGIYWNYMPDYLDMNYLNHQNKLPDFYWTGDTKMKCMQNCIEQTKIHCYSHHIQRLMVTGNFATLVGVNPKHIHEWYMAVYADAHEWVEVPNTIGMSGYADGGIVGTKPYVSTSNYINKMSDFCQNCSYDCNQKTGPKACPFNYLYWNFLLKNEEKLKDNIRCKMAYATLKKMSSETKKQIQQDSKNFLDSLTYTKY